MLNLNTSGRGVMLALLIFAVCFGLCNGNAYAQATGSVAGVITDKETGETMIGAAVVVEGTTRGAATDLDGNYLIKEVPVGPHNLVVMMLGYARTVIKAVQVDSAQVTKVNVQVTSEALQIEEVVIEAKAVNNTEASLLSLRKRSPTVADGISEEQIKKSPDADAGEAVKRVTGVTVVGDKYVFIRGMGERYNNTRLNGSTIASPEPLKRVVPFDVIPANLLENIIVNKTFTPDQPGDFAGGSVQLTTREFPEKLTVGLSNSLSYNDQSTFREFLSYRGGDKDWIGVDDGTREIPGPMQDASSDPEQTWQLDTLAPKELAKSFKNVWEPTRASAPFSGSRSFSVGNQQELFGKPVGYLLTLTHSSSYTTREERQSAYVPSAAGLEKYQDFAVDRSTYSVNWGGILDLNTKLSSRHKLSLKTLYTRSADDVVRTNEGATTDQLNVRTYRLSWIERSLLSSQLKGAHELPTLLASRLEWSGNYSRATWEEPDRRDVDYFRVTEADPYLLAPGRSPAARRFAEMEDNIHEGMLDWQLPLKFMKEPGSKLKLGTLARTLDRSFPTHKYLFKYDPDPDQPSPDFSLPPEVLFSPRFIDRYFELDEVSLALDSYDASMNVLAGYAMADLAIGKRWRAVGGVRVEDTDQHFETVLVPGSEGDATTEGGPRHTDVLPALNLTYKLNEKTNLRAAGSMTIANPDYAEIVPTEDQDYFQGASKTGNPDSLNHSKILNLDFRWEYYPTWNESFACGVFFKHVTDPIEATWINTGAINTIQPQNFADANNLGGEFEVRKALPYLAPHEGHWLSYFSTSGNFTYVSSQVDASDYWFGDNSGMLTSRKRPMVGQSEYVINLTLGYDHPTAGLSCRLLYNTFGKRISQLGTYNLPDTYEQPFEKFDATVDQKLDAHWSVKLRATNLLDTEVQFTVGDEVLQSYKLGRTFGVGASYTL